VSFEAAGYLASMHGLTVNAGEQSRWDDEINVTYCENMRRRIVEGRFDDDTLYLATAAALPGLLVSGALACEVLDRMNVCATPDSRARWELVLPAAEVTR
jgi:hypothetical protein